MTSAFKTSGEEGKSFTHGYNLRRREPGREQTTEISQGNQNVAVINRMAEPVMMTTEQLQVLLAGMRTIVAEERSSTPTPQPILHADANFTKCQSRFGGTKDEDVEAFINATSIYKECLQITEANALKGLPMLLDGQAATWFQGTKSLVLSWEDALKGLRHAFGRNLPPHKIFTELFSKPQGEKEQTDKFVSNCRALLSQLPTSSYPVLHETHKLDMIYGLLHRRIRSKVARDQVTNFDTLITKARSVEDDFVESYPNPALQAKALPEKFPKQRPKCTFCRAFGHSQSECRKFLGIPNSNGNKNAEIPANSSVVSPSQRSTGNIVCYGCGLPGYVRSQCPNCKSHAGLQQRPTTSTSVNSVSSVELLAAEFGANATRPLVRITVQDLTGVAYVDSGAGASIAGHRLYNHLLTKNVPFTESVMNIILADGNPKNVPVVLFHTIVNFHEYAIPLQFIAVPQHLDSKTLLGVDFIKAARLLLNIPDMQYYFIDKPEHVYDLIPEPEIKRDNVAMVSTIDAITLRDDEGVNLNNSERNRLNILLDQHKEIFAENREATPFAEHTIKLTDETPISVPPYRLSPFKREVLRKEIDKMLEDDVIEECESAYAAPVVLVPKKDGKFRVCVDYRRLNSVTIPDRYPLPRIDDLLDAAKPKMCMSTMDLRSGYWQVAVKVDDRDKTGFITPFGIYRFKRMPFGMRNSPATFQRLMDRFKAGLREITVLAYLDDLIIISSNFDEHIEHLSAVVERLKTFKLKANRPKCTFASVNIKYLGHIITPTGICPDPGKISAISERESPRNLKQVLSFLQTCSWFRRFVPNFASVARPLTDLTRKNVFWKWGSAQQEAFDTLKGLLTSAPILRSADPTLPYVLRTDASSYAIGACLLQGEGDVERPIEYASRLLSAAERNYSTTEREALAVVYAVQKFRGYLEGVAVTVATDH